MEMSMERDSSALGSLFQQIINDMKNTSPLWEDFVAKASKLHACLRAAIQAIAAYLDAFQKIADAATNSRGASKEIGTALTRVCLRHKAVETRLKTFTAAIMDCLVQPLQDKLEDWKRSVATIDKEHAKEYKRCRTELKKRSTDTLRLQKKARKGQSDTLQSLMDSHMQDVTLRRAELEEVEKKSLRSAMIEERMRYCSFVHMLQPVVKEECEVMSELGHLQEAMQSIALVTKEPQVLPAASEELIHDAKASITLYPESPSASAGGGGSLSQGGCSNSLGSRKSSVCSISSMNSSGSSNSPGHPHYPRSLSQLISPSIRLKPGESSDSGFCSSPALTTQASSINNPSHAVTTWPTHSQDTVDLPSNASERPHTISSAYEKGHQRPPLTVYTFQNPETILEGGGGGNVTAINNGGSGGSSSGQNTPSTQKSPAGALTRPPLPVRCSSLERPLSANNSRGNGTNLMQRQCPSPIPAHVTKGSTRIARRSSVNTAKPPPPVRRSSSVTPSPNTPTTPTNSNAINMLHQQAHSLNTSTENLPPPPAYLLDARQTTPTTPPSAMPNSSQKVSETVKALSGLRHQPASPHTLRRLQQQQQQQQLQQQSMLQPPKQYQHQYTKSSPVLLSPPTIKRTTPTPLSPPSTDLDEIPPPLPPPNPHQSQTPPSHHNHHHQHQLSLPLRYQQQLPTPIMTAAHSNNNHMTPQQLQHHNQQPQQQYQDQQQLEYNNGESLYGTNSPTSFRTSSPGGGIYAQPKILNNMSSFRTNSPGPNGHHQTPTTQSHVPAQPKTNPNLIAQLNARLNSKQPSNSNEAIYGVSSINHHQHQQREEIYMRNYQQQQHQHQQMSPHATQQQQQPPQHQQQQQTYDATAASAAGHIWYTSSPTATISRPSRHIRRPSTSSTISKSSAY